MASSKHVLRIRRSDGGDDDFVLLNVTSNGPAALDLRLLATEGEAPYVTDIKQGRISKLRDKKSVQDDSEWESTLLSMLLQRRRNAETRDVKTRETIEIIASVADARLNIVFRKNISGITKRLGEITLQQDDDIELDMLSWNVIAIERGNALEEEIQDLTLKYKSSQQSMAKLSQQLEDLITAKATHENVLLAKFAELLNAKKRKIRDQNRLLAGSKVDRTLARTVQASRGSGTAPTPTTPGRSGKGKRKAVQPDEDEGDDEGAFEGSSSAHIKDEHDSADEPPKTPEASDEDATEDDDDDDLDINKEGNITVGSQHAEPTHEERMQLDSPPPARDLPPDRALPFGEPLGTQKASTLQQQEAGNEDEETDDDDDDEL